MINMAYQILNGKNDIMRVGWKNADGTLHEESRWETREKAEEALCLLTKYAIAGALDEREGMRIIQVGDA